MSIVSTADILEFVGVTVETFNVSASSDTLILSYDGGLATTVHIATDNTYSAEDLAASAQTAINSAFASSCTVTWSSITRLFTFSFPGHTIAFTLVGSEAGTLFGFDQNHAAAATLTSDNPAGDPTAIVLSLHTASEAAIENYCRRSFMSAAYTLEKYSSDGTPYIRLKNYPVTAVQMISVGTRDAMYVYNTSTTSFASVSVSSTGLTLSRDGATDSSPTFAANTTLGALVTAINLVGNGWVAAISSSTYNSFKSSFLLSKMGQSAIDSNYVYLQIPEEPESDFEVDENNGVVKLSWPIPCGFKNVYVSYSAGFAVAPADLQLAIKTLVKNLYDKKESATWGIASYSIGDLTMRFSDMATMVQNNLDLLLPPEVISMLSKYRKILV